LCMGPARSAVDQCYKDKETQRDMRKRKEIAHCILCSAAACLEWMIYWVFDLPKMTSKFKMMLTALCT
jgi:hypothetical protein